MGLDITGYDPLKSGGLPKPGRAHFLVSDIEDKGNYYSATCEILAHDEASEVGKISYTNLNKAGKAARRLQLFLEATKVITREMIEEAVQTGKTEIDFDIESAVGTTFFGLLEAGSYTKDGKTKDTCKIEWKFFGIDDPAADDYPRNTEFAPAPKVKEGKAKEEKPAQQREEKATAGATAPASDDDCPF